MNPNENWLELEPWGVSMTGGKARPLLLLREKAGDRILPVWLSHLDAGISLTQGTLRTGSASPHDLTFQLLKKLKLLQTKGCPGR